MNPVVDHIFNTIAIASRGRALTMSEIEVMAISMLATIAEDQFPIEAALIEEPHRSFKLAELFIKKVRFKVDTIEAAASSESTPAGG